jgi:hypothetical protein
METVWDYGEKPNRRCIRTEPGQLLSNTFEEFWPHINRKFLHER